MKRYWNVAVAAVDGAVVDEVEIDTTQLKKHIHLCRNFPETKRGAGLRPYFGIDLGSQLGEPKHFERRLDAKQIGLRC